MLFFHQIFLCAPCIVFEKRDAPSIWPAAFQPPLGLARRWEGQEGAKDGRASQYLQSFLGGEKE